ncbi:MAG: hypothetical protein AAF533_08845 [Acidobacteriota bacterium]
MKVTVLDSLPQAGSRALLALALAVLGLGAGVPARATAPSDCADVVVLDRAADPGAGPPNGAVFAFDFEIGPAGSDELLGGEGGAGRRTDVAVLPDRRIFVADAEVDPMSQGSDPNGGVGRGGIYAFAPLAGNLVLVADGNDCSPMMGCPDGGWFVDPTGLAWRPGTEQLVVADPEANPFGLGPDRDGGSGYGALFSVDVATGFTTLLSDGTAYFTDIPDGRPSIFEEPVAVALDGPNLIHVLDRGAEPVVGVGHGAWLTVELPSGWVTRATTSSEFLDLRDIARGPDGVWLLDGGDSETAPGVIGPDPAAGAVLAFRSSELVDPVSFTVLEAGVLLVLDSVGADVDGDGMPDTAGAIYRVDTTAGGAPLVTLQAQTSGFVEPVGLAKLEPLALTAASPSVAMAGTAVTVRVTGGPFEAGATADFGEGVLVGDVRLVGRSTLDVDVVIEPGATAGFRDVLIENPIRTQAFHCDLFEITRSASCASQAEGLKVEAPGEGRIRLSWEASEGSCNTTYRVYRAMTPRPTDMPGQWRSDPSFVDISTEDEDGSVENTTFLTLPEVEGDEYFLVVTVLEDGSELVPEHYSP